MEYTFNNKTLKYMYRYLLKYVGTYRVLPVLDKDTGDIPRNEDGTIDESYEDLYIKCKRGGIVKHTYKGNDILVIEFENKSQTARKVYKDIKKMYNNIEIEYEEIIPDGFIYFNAKDIDKIDKIIKLSRYGAKIKPFASRNIKSNNKSSTKQKSEIDFNIPQEELDYLNEKIKFEKPIKAAGFYRSRDNKFIKENNLYDKYKKSGMKSKEFIYSCGKWKKYKKYIVNEYINI